MDPHHSSELLIMAVNTSLSEKSHPLSPGSIQSLRCFLNAGILTMAADLELLAVHGE